MGYLSLLGRGATARYCFGGASHHIHSSDNFMAGVVWAWSMFPLISVRASASAARHPTLGLGRDSQEVTQSEQFN